MPAAYTGIPILISSLTSLTDPLVTQPAIPRILETKEDDPPQTADRFVPPASITSTEPFGASSSASITAFVSLGNILTVYAIPERDFS